MRRALSVALAGLAVATSMPAHGQFQLPEPSASGKPGALMPSQLRFQYSWTTETEVTLRHDADLDKRHRDDSVLAKPQINGVFVFRPTAWMEMTAETILEREIPIKEASEFAPPKRRPSLILDQAFVQLKAPGNPLGLFIGRRNFEDDRHWLFDTSLDVIGVSYRQGAVRAEVSAGRETATNLEFWPHQHQPSDHINTYNLYAEYRGIEEMKLAAYVVGRDDRTGREGKPMLMGVRALGTPGGAFSHWADAAILRGHDEQGRRFDGHAFDVGFTYRWTRAAYGPNVTFGYAFGTGGGAPADANNREFRQTGLHSNESRFAGNAPFKVYGEALDPELSNLHVLTAGFGVRPSFETSFDIVAHRYYLDKLADEVRNSGVRALMNQARISKDVGSGLDLVLGLRNMFGIKRLGVDFRAGWFFPGKAYQRNVGTEAQPDIRSADKSFAIVFKLWW